MEVHPPEHGIHTWRDFLVHMGTITLGLLIALGLEGLVERWHHQHLVHTARENLRAEVEVNLSTLRRDKTYLDAVQRDLDTDLHTLRGMPTNPDKTHAHLVSGWTWDGLSASAYNTAQETGAFNFMPYDEVQHIDTIFVQQRYVNGAVDTYIRDVTNITLPLQGGRTLADASPADIQRMEESCSASTLDILLLRAFIRGLESDYQSFLREG